VTLWAEELDKFVGKMGLTATRNGEICKILRKIYVSRLTIPRGALFWSSRWTRGFTKRTSAEKCVLAIFGTANWTQFCPGLSRRRLRAKADRDRKQDWVFWCPEVAQ